MNGQGAEVQTATVECIRIRGARTHNLRNVDLDIPRDRFVVVTGPSGSGKSSLAFDTLYAEGQRQYIESLSIHARQFLRQLERPDVDLIDGLQPTISVDQRPAPPTREAPWRPSPRRTTVCGCCTPGWARRVVVAAARRSGSRRRKQILDSILARQEGTRIMVLGPDGPRAQGTAP